MARTAAPRTKARPGCYCAPNAAVTMKVDRDPVHGFQFFVDPPRIGLHELGALNAEIIMPLDGGWWIADRASGIRYRRITMADLPKHVTWNTRGKGRYNQDEDAGE